MEDWKEYKLGEIAKIKGGKRLPKGVNLISVPNNHPYIRVRDLGSKKTIELDSSFEYVDDETQHLIDKYIVRAGDIIISIVGTIGLISIVGDTLDNANLTENCVKLVDIESINKDFLYYYLFSEIGKKEIQKGIVGAVQAKLPIKNIQNISIYAPNRYIQQRISSVLSSLDDKIECNRKINENLEAQAQALFKSWFVDFEPFRDGPFIESELGPIPQGWRVTDLGHVTTAINDRIKNRKDVKVLSPVTTGELVLSEEYFSKQVYSESIAKYIIVRPNEFAYNPARVNIGSLGMNTFNFDGCVSPVYVVFSCEKDYHFFFDLFRMTKLFSEEVKTRAIGGVRQTLGYKDFSLIKIIYPPHAVIEEFNRFYSTLVETKRMMIQESRRLAELRDALLPRLMSGELRVSDVEQLEELA